MDVALGPVGTAGGEKPDVAEEGHVNEQREK